LLQGSYFTPTDLSSIAQQLDQEELETLISGDPANAEKLKSEFRSVNYDDSGFFSVQVVQKALDIWGLELLSIRSSQKEAVDAKFNPESCVAFICNLEEHWFTLRKFGGSNHRWYNLNSVYKEPMYVTQTYLAMLLQQLQTEGYSIFLVLGEVPVSKADEEAYLTPIPLAEENNKREDSEADLKKAIAMSLGEDPDDELQAALKASMMDAGVDEESMRLAIEASLSEVKHVPPLPQPVAPLEDMDEIRRKRLERFGHNH
jgi:ataxin-3